MPNYRTVAAHNGFYHGKLASNDKYELRKENDGVAYNFTLDLEQHPHVTESALAEYDKLMIEGGGGMTPPSRIYESTKHTVYMFPQTDSETVKAIWITVGRMTFSMDHRLGARRLPEFNNALRKFESYGYNGNIQEVDPRHVGIHIPGTPAAGVHKHFYNNSGGTVKDADIAKLVVHLAETGLIYPPHYPGVAPKPGGKYGSRNAGLQSGLASAYARTILRKLGINQPSAEF